jgi:uncharacterized heparinase superfamily protein
MISLGRYWRTLRHLRPSQVAWQLYYRIVPAPRARRLGGLQPRGALRPQAFASPVVPAGISANQISFLNHARPLAAEAVDWVAPAESKLWRYNLHYFDYLHWPVYPAALKGQLVDSWIAANPPTAGEGWEPYPLSLRTVNWIKWWLGGGLGVSQAWLDSLATQFAWLERRLEYHLLANHLLKNGKALFFGGVFFSGPDADRWRERGLEILLREADEQILADGGHYERSPMYHCIVLEDYLDVLNLIQAVPGLVPAAAERRLRAAASRALRFLADITAGDGRIPLFNDAAFGIAPEPAALLAYGAGLVGAPAGAPMRIYLPDTGYYGYRHNGDSLILDCGPVGPDYQPGHTHCDTLSYELCVAGQRVVVDAGTHSYGLDDRRHQARQTRSHNTVELDGVEQSEIWGAFRVGRRARPISPDLGAWQDGRLLFSGSHDGYRHLPGQPRHERRIVMAPTAGCWEIHDLITGNNASRHKALSCIHLDPSFSVRPEEQGVFVLSNAEAGLALRLTVTCGSAAIVKSGYHFPEFGLCQENSVICVERSGVLPIEMHYRIERI